MFLVTHCSNRITGSDFKAASLGDSCGRCGHGLPRHVSEVEGKSNRFDLLHQLAGLPPPSLPTPARGSLHRAKVKRVTIGATIDEAEALNCIDLMLLKSHLQPSSQHTHPAPKKALMFPPRLGLNLLAKGGPLDFNRTSRTHTDTPGHLPALWGLPDTNPIQREC